MSPKNAAPPPVRRTLRRENILNTVDLNLLRVFDVLMKERSVTRAAERLGRTQPAVSHSLSRLRHLFKDELFSREGGTLEPTSRAEDLALEIGGALSVIRHAMDQHLNFDPRVTARHFRIGLSDYTAVIFLPQLVDAFRRQAPHASLNVLHAREGDVANSLKSKEVDYAILGNTQLQGVPFRLVELGRDRMVCAAWKGNPLTETFDTAAYLASPHLQISADGTAPGAADAALEEMGKSRRVIATIPHYLVAPWVIKGTDLITVFGDSVLPAISSESETRVLDLPFPLPDVSISLVHKVGMEQDSGHKWFLGLVRQVITEQRSRKEEAYRRLRQ